MLGTFLKRLWRAREEVPLPGPGLPAIQTAVGNEVRSALATMLREPLPYPKTIDYEMIAHLKAAAGSADYMIHHMMAAQNLVRRDALLEFGLEHCAVDGLIMEFGVYRGESLRLIAKRTGEQVHGFDSFEGLPEDWTYFQKQGRFSLQGKAPHFDQSNVQVHKGSFSEVLPLFLSEHAGPARFVHVDCDIYSSTRSVLELIGPRIVRGSVIVFDEYLNYPGWEQHEFKAFQEFIHVSRMKYRYLGFASSECAVAVEMI